MKSDPEHVEPTSQDYSLPFLGRKVLSILRPHGLLVAGVVVLSVGAALSEGLTLALVLPLIESFGGGDAGTSASAASDMILGSLMPFFRNLSTAQQIQLIAGLLVGFQFLKASFDYASGRLAHLLQIRIDRETRLAVFDQLLDVEISYINDRKVGNLFTILNNYCGHVARIGFRAVDNIPAVVLLGMYLVSMLTISWKLTLGTLALAGVVTVAMGRLSGKARELGDELNEAAWNLNHVGIEYLRGMRLVRMFGREDHAHDRFDERVQERQSAAYRKGLLTALIQPLNRFLSIFAFSVILVVGTLFLAGGAAFWQGILALFVVILFRLMAPVSQLNGQWNQIQGYIPSLLVVTEVLDDENKPFLEEGDRRFHSLEEGIEFDDVSFRYGEDEPQAVRDVSFSIERGETVAMVGESGAGKSTVVKLLARLHDPDEGEVRVDGVDLREFDSRTWRDGIAVVSQNTYLFNDTIRDNLLFGDPEATEEELREAAKTAHAHEFVEDLPNGFNTRIGDQGVRLSGGQAQRIAIARALLADPEILILDEATSSLDSETEAHVQDALSALMEDRTVFAIAHRLSTISSSDEIIVIEDGEIVERGTHEELLQREGRYWEFVELQNLVSDGAAETVLESSAAETNT